MILKRTNINKLIKLIIKIEGLIYININILGIKSDLYENQFKKI